MYRGSISRPRTIPMRRAWIDNPTMRRTASWGVLLAMLSVVSVLALMGRTLLLLLVVAAAIGWLIWRRREPGSSVEREPARAAEEGLHEQGRRAAIDRAFNLFIVLYVISAALWLAAGLVPAVARAWPSVHEALHRYGGGTSLLAELASNAARASHNAYGAGLVSLEYVFSAVNLGLGIFLALRGPRQPAARLLAIGMVGTAVAFNLQGHWARQVVPTGTLGAIEVWHSVLVHVLSGVAYVFALLLFPDGKLANPRRAPLLVFVLFAFVLMSLITAEDHTFGLVLVFGLFIPLAGAISQVGRFRRSVSAQTRRQTRVVLFGLILASASALGLIGANAVFGSAPEGVTVVHELGELRAGTYFFRCDPHPDTMIGTVVVAPASGSTPPPVGKSQVVVAIYAENDRFDRRTLALPAGQDVQLRFTNRDADGHNVAIYTDPSARTSLFVGDVFSGNDLTARAFRVFQPVFVVIPLTLFFGLLRFHLWRFERVLHKALVYGFLASFITVVYSGVVVGIGRSMDSAGGGDLLLSIVATAVVAIAFEPLRGRLQRLANVLVYGKRASPYEVLTDFSDQMAGSLSIDEVLPRMAEAAARGVGADRSRVHVLLPDGGARSVDWPEGTEQAGAERFDRTLVIEHKGEPVGGVSIAKPPGDAITPEEDRLLADLASQAGLALQNVRLTAELQTRLQEISAQTDELRASRQRIVAAQDAAARRLERNIHDGAQQQLVAIGVTARLARSLASRDPARTEELLTKLGTDTEEALQTLRDLARGIYPSLLSDKGISAALEAQIRKFGLPVVLEEDGAGRYSSETEAAVYFCCLEALQNVAKHAGASAVTVRLRGAEGWLEFSVVDDGSGFASEGQPQGSGLQNMRDRLSALGGTVAIRSTPGSGTTVDGRVPATPR